MYGFEYSIASDEDSLVHSLNILYKMKAMHYTWKYLPAATMILSFAVFQRVSLKL
jgi:hypothetical protein